MASSRSIPTIFKMMEPYLDAHLLVMISDYFLENSVGTRKEALENLIRLVKKTKMIGYEISLAQQLSGADSPLASELTEKQEQVSEMVKKWHEKAVPVVEVLASAQFKESFEFNSRDPETVIEKCVAQFELPADFLNMAMQYAHVMYDTGLYGPSATVLSVLRDLTDKRSPEYVSSLWGEIACQILLNELDAAAGLLETLKKHLDSLTISKRELQFNIYAHYMHWCLFVYLKTPEYTERVPELFIHCSSFRHVLETICPYLIRYVVVATVLHTNKGEELKNVLELVLQEEHQYSDSFTSLIKCVLHEYDLDSGLRCLSQCEEDITCDYFIAHLKPDFLFCAQLLILRVYSQTHCVVRAPFIAEMFGVGVDLAQRLIAALFNISIEQASEPSHPSLGCNPIYDQVLYRGSNLADRVTQTIIPELDRKVTLPQPSKDRRRNTPAPPETVS